LGNPCQVPRPPSVKDPAAFATKVATEAVEAVKSAVSVKNASTSGVFSTSIMISFREYPGRYAENFVMEQPQASTLVCFCPSYGLVLWGEEALTDKLLLALEITVMISGNCEMCASVCCTGNITQSLLDTWMQVSSSFLIGLL
jgi:hypothetical protein